MRKRSKTKKAAQAITKAAIKKNAQLDKLFANVKLTRRDWYTTEVHSNMLATLPNKLQTIKNLMDISREKDGDGRYGLKELKDFVDQFSVRPIYDHNLSDSLPFNTKKIDADIHDKVVDLINDEIQDEYSTTGLSHLLNYVPVRILQDYWDANKD
jgi:hypothetical protein